MAVSFYLDNRPNKNGDHPIRVSISINGNRYVTSTGFSVNAEKWNNGKEKMARPMLKEKRPRQ
jgi:hypothetical protein